jgi:hypothetical protein
MDGYARADGGGKRRRNKENLMELEWIIPSFGLMDRRGPKETEKETEQGELSQESIIELISPFLD